MQSQESSRNSLRDRITLTFHHVEQGLYVALAALLGVTSLLALFGAAATLWSGFGDWTGTNSTFVVIDRLLVVLMLIEILHTVEVSVRSGALTCEPFLVVGLIASIRRVLVITLESSQAMQKGEMSEKADRLFRTSMVELAVLSALILVMVGSIYLLRRAHQETPALGPPGDTPQHLETAK